MHSNGPGDRLDSWKEIAAHLRRDESTVRRWEKSGLPVHRHRHKSRAAVFAYRSELDTWWQRDCPNTAANASATETTAAVDPIDTIEAATATTGAEVPAAAPDDVVAPVIPARRHPLLWTGIVLVTLALSLLGAYWVHLAGSTPATTAPILTPFLSADGDVSYPAFAPDDSQLAFVWATAEAPHASIYVKAIGGGTALRLTYPADGADSAAKWSPDGRQIAFLRTTATDASIFVVPATGGPERQLLTLRPDRYFDLDWSSDGKWIAFAERASERDPYSIFLLNIRDGTRRQLTQAPAGSFGEVRFSLSPDGRELAFLRREVESAFISLQVVSIDEPSSIRMVASYSEWVGGVTWSAAGDSLILAGNQGGVRKLWRVSIKTGRDEALPGLGTDEYYPAVSRRGSRIAFVRDIEDCDLWRSELTADGGGRTPVRILSSKRVEGAPRFSPDGKKLAFQSYRSGVPEIWISNPDGTDAVQVTNLRTSKPEMPAWSPDGRWLAFADGGFHVINSTGGQPRRLFTSADDFDGPSWSHDGQQIGPEAVGDAAFDAVNYGNESVSIDARTGAAVDPPPARAPAANDSPRPALRVDRSGDHSSLVLVRPGQPERTVWMGNPWLAQIRTGRSEAIAYTSADGKPLTGWLLYPPDHVAGTRLPIVTMIYPSTVYNSSRVPALFDPLTPEFEHPQLLAALGYGVLLPSMPGFDAVLKGDSIPELGAGVLPAIDALISRGIADPGRIAVVGHSAGGWATLGLIAITGRFRTAIASASYSNLESLYGTFYGQYRYGDSGDPRRAQLLRMLQFERALFGAGAPPWEAPEAYRRNSPITRAAAITTPLMLVHGDSDFIPVQQAEEMFTALYRQDKRVRLVRYAGEGHVITGRAHVLDLWRQIARWLDETMR